MQQRDVGGWRQVESGSLPTWETVVDLGEAPWLTSEGCELRTRMLAEIREVLDDEWLGEAFRRRESGVFALLARLSPALSPRPEAAMAELIVFWLSVTSTSTFAGYNRVISTIKTDLNPQAFQHALLQLRLAVLANTDAREVVFESAVSVLGGPVDLVLSMAGMPLGIEAYAPVIDTNTREYDRAYGANTAHLDDLSHKHGIHWRGDVPAKMHADVLEAWHEATARAAEEAERSGVPSLVRDETGGELLAAPGPAPVGAGLRGPELSTDVGLRLRYALRKKADQASRSGACILWVDDHGATDLLFAYDSLSPAQKLEAINSLLRSVLEETPSLEALVFARRRPTFSFPTTPATTIIRQDRALLALTDPYPGARRETAILSRDNLDSNTDITRLVVDEHRLWVRALSTATGHDDWGSIIRPPANSSR